MIISLVSYILNIHVLVPLCTYQTNNVVQLTLRDYSTKGGGGLSYMLFMSQLVKTILKGKHPSWFQSFTQSNYYFLNVDYYYLIIMID